MYASLSSGIFEEIDFRGVFLIILLKKGFKEHSAILIIALLFGGAHFINILMGREIFEVLFQMIGSFLFELVLGYLLVKTKSLLPSIFLHYSINAFWGMFQYVFTDSIELMIVIALWTLTPLMTIQLYLWFIEKIWPSYNLEKAELT
ncbi:MAG: CPBP family intramembrane glutamic endopeptidase [Candidatus Hodarchaeales archaeon]